ncbi:hypothetical protein, partial [Legionella steigerwaltii]
MIIELSTTSQELIKKLSESKSALAALAALLPKNAPTINRKDLLEWFAQTSKIATNDEAFFLIASLQASLLKDLNKSLNPGQNEDETKKPGMSAAIKYGLLALAGTIYFGCEGFDGVTAFMGMFSSIPTLVLFGVGTLFSILSMIVFYSFDLVEISKNLGIKSSDTPQLLDVLLEQFKQIKAIRARLTGIADKTKEQLIADLELARKLLQLHIGLKEARDKFNAALENPYLKAGKYITTGVVGIIFFSGGFFAGQTVSLAIASLFVASIAATAWPIVVASILVGLGALAVYCFVERPKIENLISRWLGLDKEKIDELCTSDFVDEETANLNKLIKELDFGVAQLEKEEADQLTIQESEKKASRVPELEKEIHRLKGELILEKSISSKKEEEHSSSALQTLSHFSHLRRTRSLNNLQDFHHLHQGDDTH